MTSENNGPFEYEYAGFKYQITRDGYWKLRVIEGQHPAASKEKHKRNALECFLEDKKAGRL